MPDLAPLLTSFIAGTLCATRFSLAAAETFEISSTSGVTLQVSVVAEFDEPWAMTFLPDRTLLVTTEPGKLLHVTRGGDKTGVAGVWEVTFAAQGGLGDVVPHPDFARNGFVCLSSVEGLDGGSTFGAVVKRARLERSGNAPKLVEVERIWTQEPKVSGRVHFSHRIAFGPDGVLYITSGDRQKKDPAQIFDTGLGKIIRLRDVGRVLPDNPWQHKGELASTCWSMGHRNPLGIAFDAEGRLWAHETGPAARRRAQPHRRGRQLRLAARRHGRQPFLPPDPGPRHRARFPRARDLLGAGHLARRPGHLFRYSGDVLPEWRGDAIVVGLSARAPVRVDIEGEKPREADRFEWGTRVREVEQGPGGALWVLEDRSGGRLLKLTPKPRGDAGAAVVVLAHYPIRRNCVWPDVVR